MLKSTAKRYSYYFTINGHNLVSWYASVSISFAQVEKFRKLLWIKYTKYDNDAFSKCRRVSLGSQTELYTDSLCSSVSSSPPVTDKSDKWRKMMSNSSNIKDQSKEKARSDKYTMQLRLNQLGLVDIVIDLLTSIGLADKIFEESLLLANALLKDGNTLVQVRMVIFLPHFVLSA